MAGEITVRNSGNGLERSRRFGVTLTLCAIIVFSSTGAAQQTVQPAGKARTSPEAKSPFFEAEELLRQGSDEEAKKNVLETLKLHPASVDGYNLLGIIYAHQKNYEAAIESFQHALKLDPNSTRSHVNLGNSLVAQEKLELAEKEFRAALRQEPSNRDGNYNLGLVLLARGQPSEAVRFFQRVHPADAGTLFNLIRAYLRSDRTADGLKLAAEVSAQGKEDVRLHFTLGGLLASEKQYEAAQHELEKANSLEPRSEERRVGKECRL